MENRRDFLKGVTASAFTLNAPSAAANGLVAKVAQPINKRLSLSQWSFHQAILGNSKKDYPKFLEMLHDTPDRVLQGSLDPRDITVMAKRLNLKTVDLVNILFFGHAMDKPWLDDFKARAEDNDINFQVLMCDQTGSLGATSSLQRQKSIDAHIPWLETAAYLGCKQLRVNAYGDGSYLQQLYQCAESLLKLSSLAQAMEIELLVENHGYASNNGAWLAMLMELSNHQNLGLFTDLDNFFMGGWGHQPERRYDRQQGLLDLAPYTRGISVKAHDFDERGRETTLDYPQYFNIFEKMGYSGLYSAEYEGSRLSEYAGTEATIAYSAYALSNLDKRSP